MSWALLTDRSVNLRYLVLKHLMDSDEAMELEKHRTEDPIVKELLSLQNPDGSWTSTDGNAPQGPVQITSQALTRLGFLEFNPDHPAVKKGVWTCRLHETQNPLQPSGLPLLYAKEAPFRKQRCNRLMREH